MTNLEKRFIYDLEIYPNFFLICLKRVTKEEIIVFQVSRHKDERPQILEFLRTEVEEMVGFNNLNYDYPLLDYAITHCWKDKGSVFCRKLTKKSKELIESQNPNHFGNCKKKQIDLFKIHHFDNHAKMCSLKLLQFNMRMENIMETPFDFDSPLGEGQDKDVIEYCKNDVTATSKLYEMTIPEIELRGKLTKMYGMDFTNFNAAKIGEQILITEIVKKLGYSAIYEYVETAHGRKKTVINTPRENIVVKDILFPYIEFKTEPFRKVTEYFKKQVITDTLTAFSRIPFEELEDLKPHYKEIKVAETQKNLNVIYKGFQYDFGAGGIHGAIQSGVYEADDTHKIIDIDISSFYPNLAIQNEYYPQHLGKEFCEIYKSVYEQRKKYAKGTVENLAYKLALNGAYGKSNSMFSPLYDPQYTMTTTINGQLLICMLCEALCEQIEDLTMLQINTDGITVKVHIDEVPKLNRINKEWEELTKLQLEYAYYKKMVIKDVNNYMAIKENGQIKRKGAAFIYEQSPSELEWHKNFSMLVVQKAVEAWFTKGIQPSEFIRKHDNIHDFFKRTKINRDSALTAIDRDEDGEVNIEIALQHITRYYISGKSEYNRKHRKFIQSGTGMTLIKSMPSRKNESGLKEINVDSGSLCSECNDLSKTSEKEIRNGLCYDYYIEEAQKIIDSVGIVSEHREKKKTPITLQKTIFDQ